jgi:ketosteroid isomerase-like protein
MKSNVDVIRDLLAAFGRGDMKAVLSLFAADVEWRMPGPKVIPYVGDRKGRPAIEKFYQELSALCDVEHWELRKLIDGGDDVVALGFETLRVKSTGKAFDQHIAIVYTLRHGKIAAVQFYEDCAAAAAAFTK